MIKTQDLPQNIEAEKNLIGLTFLEKRIPQGARELATTDFYSPIYRAAWSAFLELEEEGREIEPFSAYEIIKRDKPDIARQITIAELTQTATGLAFGLNERVFAKKIKATAQSRFIIRELYASIEAVMKGGGDISGLKRRLDDLEGIQSGTGHFRSLADILEQDVKPALVDLHHGITHRISTGFDAIDKVIGGGVSLSDVILIAAMPGAGKSLLALQLAVNFAKQNVGVAFLSGEMSDKENVLRLLSQAAKVLNLNSAVHIHADELHILNQWADALKQLPIFFDSKTYDLQTASRALRTLVEETGVKVLVVDYIQIFKLNRFERQQRFERIAECSQEIKRMAMEMGVAVIEVAQFNREGAKSLKPTMSDLEGSGQLEKDASLIFIIDHEETTGEITLRVEKGRNTGKCKIAGRFTGGTLNFEF